MKLNEYLTRKMYKAYYTYYHGNQRILQNNMVWMIAMSYNGKNPVRCTRFTEIPGGFWITHTSVAKGRGKKYEWLRSLGFEEIPEKYLQKEVPVR